MTDSSKSPLSDSQVENVLTSFFASEMPAALEVPPSQWPEIQANKSLQETASPTLATRAVPATPQPQSGRIVALLFTVAACLTLFAVLPESSNDSSVTIPVSSSGDAEKSGEPIFDGQPTLEELEDVKLEP